jgi:hypothetical protein
MITSIMAGFAFGYAVASLSTKVYSYLTHERRNKTPTRTFSN